MPLNSIQNQCYLSGPEIHRKDGREDGSKSGRRSRRKVQPETDTELK